MNLSQRAIVVAFSASLAAWAAGAIGLWAIVAVVAGTLAGYVAARFLFAEEIALAEPAGRIAGAIERIVG